ncbi:MAG: ABC transporter substrate-binding protein [Thermodesulfobacteriota bacterium]
MAKIRLALVASVMIMFVATSLFPTSAEAAKILYIGGTMSLTGAYAEDSAAILAAYEDYVKYVNETKMLAPWRNEKFPADITLELLWRDDELKPAKALTIYEELKAKGILVYRISGTPIALALKDRLWDDHMGATSMSVGPYLLTPPRTIFTNTPLYTDELAAIADWFKANWKETRKPRFAYLTADSPFGRSVEIPEVKAYLEKVGYEFVGAQYVPLVPTSPPTTQLMWLKEKGVDLVLGAMVNPGAQPTIKEAVRLGMGPHLGYKITFGFAYPCIPYIFCRDMGELGNGTVIGGSFPSWEEGAPGIKFADQLQGKYRPDKRVGNTMYFEGMVEAMTQVEALRLALQKVPFEKLTPRIVLEQGYYQIKNLDTGGLSSTPLNYGPGKIEGVDAVRIDQVQAGKYVKVGSYPLRHIYTLP